MSETPPAEDFQSEIDSFVADYERIVSQVGRVIVGQDEVIDQVLTCLLAGGHALLEGVPGLGKTLLVRTLADGLDLRFSRIQFTPDLMPADITGTHIVAVDDSGNRTFRFEPGPIFANLVLGDEINRATPKTQSAVLEAMQEQTVSVARTTHELPQPFCVLATQNPLEMEGTYPLPEAQMDRFLLKVDVKSPSLDELVSIIDRTTGSERPRAEPAADAAKLLRMRRTVPRVPAAEHMKQYAARVTLATHPSADEATENVRRYVRYGASPRGAQAMILAGKVSALRDGRACVSTEDIRSAAPAALRHRLILSFEGQADGAEPDDIISEVLAAVDERSER
ncbi:MAG: AAA family ATPase [Phycisphaerae bacterium]